MTSGLRDAININDNNNIRQSAERLQVLACDVTEHFQINDVRADEKKEGGQREFANTSRDARDLTPNNIIERDSVRKWLDAQACGGSERKRRRVSRRQRLAANTRERNRMSQLNEAFDSLRDAIPRELVTSGAVHSRDKKLSRIQTLKVACEYIGFMTDLLQKTGNSFTSRDLNQHWLSSSAVLK